MTLGPVSTATTSPQITGSGTLATGASALISTLTLDANGSGWPLTQTSVTFLNSGSTVNYIRPFGGTSSATTGIPLAAAASVTWNLSAQELLTMTVFNASSGTLWCWW